MPSAPVVTFIGLLPLPTGYSVIEMSAVAVFVDEIKKMLMRRNEKIKNKTFLSVIFIGRNLLSVLRNCTVNDYHHYNFIAEFDIVENNITIHD